MRVKGLDRRSSLLDLTASLRDSGFTFGRGVAAMLTIRTKCAILDARKLIGRVAPWRFDRSTFVVGTREGKLSSDPHAVKINIDGNCWKNPGGSGGLGVRVDYGCDIDRECEVVEYRGYFETNNQRMGLRACIFAHEWIADNTDDLGARRFIILTDSSYVSGGYSWVIGWAQNVYATRIGRPIKNRALWKALMTLRRKLSRCARIEVKLVPRRFDEGAKEVDQTAKAAGKLPSNVDWGFRKGDSVVWKGKGFCCSKGCDADAVSPAFQIWDRTQVNSTNESDLGFA